MKAVVLEFMVAASRRHAFDTWANRTSLWWPRDHTISGAEGTDIIFEGRSGGRIFERDPDGSEHDWGRIVEWDPPRLLSYTWHLFFDPAEATDITVTFTEAGSGTTVRIEQTGWERLGAVGVNRRERTHNAWKSITASYMETCDSVTS